MDCQYKWESLIVSQKNLILDVKGILSKTESIFPLFLL